MGKCIHNHVNILTNDLICSEQHGFIKGKSCSTQLMGVYHEIGSYLDSSIQTDIIYLDFSKAFDSVSHRLLLHKLKMYGFNGRLLDRFTSYISDRKQRVVVEDLESSWLNVSSGVPQGSILGPLFLLFIDDMPKAVSSSKLGLFADDSKFHRKVLSHNDCQLLQNDINNLYDYGIRWGLKFSFVKCTMLSVTRKKVPIDFTYTINNRQVRRVQSMKYLGVSVTSDLSWNSHINTLVSKCNRTMGMIKRSVGYKAPINVTYYLYSTLVRSNIEHCSTVWSTFHFNEMQALGSIQRAATRYILPYTKVKYSERCTTLNLLPLAFRRDCADLIFFYKCLHGLYAVQLEGSLDTNLHHKSLRSTSANASFALGSQKQRRSDNPTLTELCPCGTIFHRI